MAKAVWGLTNKEFRAKYSPKSKRSNRQNWWTGLSIIEKKLYIAKKKREKYEKRREYEETHWREAIIGDRRKYCCKTCYHLKLRCCEGLSKLSKICKYFYSLKKRGKKLKQCQMA